MRQRKILPIKSLPENGRIFVWLWQDVFQHVSVFKSPLTKKNRDFLNVLRDTISVGLSTQRSLIHTYNLFITLFSDKVQLNNAARLSPLVMILVLVFS